MTGGVEPSTAPLGGFGEGESPGRAANGSTTFLGGFKHKSAIISRTKGGTFEKLNTHRARARRFRAGPLEGVGLGAAPHVQNQ